MFAARNAHDDGTSNPRPSHRTWFVGLPGTKITSERGVEVGKGVPTTFSVGWVSVVAVAVGRAETEGIAAVGTGGGFEAPVGAEPDDATHPATTAVAARSATVSWRIDPPLPARRRTSVPGSAIIFAGMEEDA